jgi:hypothetical protein
LKRIKSSRKRGSHNKERHPRERGDLLTEYYRGTVEVIEDW